MIFIGNIPDLNERYRQRRARDRQPARRLPPQRPDGGDINWWKWILVVIAVIIILFSVDLLQGNGVPTNGTVAQLNLNAPEEIVDSNENTSISVEINPTNTRISPTPTKEIKPTNTKIIIDVKEETSPKTPLVKPIPSNYYCPDLSSVTLGVGARAQIQWDKVNLRSYARVPNDWDANTIISLNKGNKMTVIGGPECAHDGTWWEVKTDSGYSGWIRELLPDKRLLSSIFR